MKDFYYILGVDANCTLNNIKEAYRKLSKKFHPDLNEGDKYFEDRFREIKEAYDILSDPAKRNEYNRELKQTFSYQTFDQPPRSQYQASPSVSRKFKRKGPGIGMSIILILLVLILGAYIVGSLSSSKTRVLQADSVAVSNLPLKIHKHHKRRHKAGNDSFKMNLDSSDVKIAQPIKSTDKLLQTANSKLAVPVTGVNQNKDYLYTTYLRPNVTGVINMRQFDNYSSVIVEKIPANSKVAVIERGDTYYKISFDNTVGYVPKWSITLK